LDTLLESRGSAVDLVIRNAVDDDKLLSRVTKAVRGAGPKDDNPETFSRRLKKYKEDTAPLRRIYAERAYWSQNRRNG